MPQYIILADDFTGAHDVGLPFAVEGLHTVVISHPEDLDAIEADVVVIDTDSRDCTVEEAKTRVRRACQVIARSKGDLIYKKIDSTCRGYIGEELDVVHEIFGQHLSVIVPAFPELGRTTVGGYHLINGIPVEQTAIGDDPGHPVKNSYLPHLLQAQSTANLEQLDLQTVLNGVEAIKQQLSAIQSTEHTIIIADAVSSEMLVDILQATQSQRSNLILCGSAGLARPLAASISAHSTPKPITTGSPSGPILVVAGSIHPVTMQQVNEAAKQSNVVVCPININALLSDKVSNIEKVRVVDLAVENLRNNQDVILSWAPHGDTDRQVWLDQIKKTSNNRNIVTILADGLGEISRRIIDIVRPGGLVIAGGQTAAWMSRHLESQGTRICQPVMDGVAMATLEGGPYGGMPLVLKPGAFGNPDGLITSISTLRPNQLPSITINERPILGITIGDPNGVGPEVITKTLSNPIIYDICRPLVIGHPDVIARDTKFATVPVEIQTVSTPSDGTYKHGVIDVLTALDIETEDLVPGQVQKSAGQLAVESVITATRLAQSGETQAVVTAPLNKEAMNLAEYHYAGHTELLAELTGTDQYRLTLAFDEMLVSHVTTHVSLKQAIDLLCEEEIIATIEIVGNALKRMGIVQPRIAVAGLNPHAGEGGMFGDEEIRIITPAVEKAREAGWHIIGPLPPDTVFLRAVRGDFDGIVGMYHDQGHIPVKAIAFDRTVNVSLGLPIIRTSVDHGTAFDIAGKGIANAENLEAAIRMAVRLVGDQWSVVRE